MCEFCENKNILVSGDLDIKIDYDVPFIKHSCLTVFNTHKSCPPFARCCDKDVKYEIHFDINFCPICGKKLQKSERGIMKDMFDIDEIILKCQIGEEHLDQSEYEQVAKWLEELKELREV